MKEEHNNQQNALLESTELYLEVNQLLLASIATEDIIVLILVLLSPLPAEMALFVQEEDQIKHGAHLASIALLRHRFK